jgi:DNA-binding NarL/FixJ family response regulator
MGRHHTPFRVFFIRSSIRSETMNSRLSEREQKVLVGIVKEWSNKKIAHELGISEAAVRFDLASIYNKCVAEPHAERVIRQLAACQSPQEMTERIKKIKRSSRGFRK